VRARHRCPGRRGNLKQTVQPLAGVGRAARRQGEVIVVRVSFDFNGASEFRDPVRIVGLPNDRRGGAPARPAPERKGLATVASSRSARENPREFEVRIWRLLEAQPQTDMEIMSIINS